MTKRCALCLPEPIYLSGPMKGYPLSNFPAFAAACELLRSFGLSIISPHEMGGEECCGDADYLAYLRGDVRVLADCRSIVMMQGWPTSSGAKLELSIALGLTMPVWFLSQSGELITMNRCEHFEDRLTKESRAMLEARCDQG